jgi:cytochrome c556
MPFNLRPALLAAPLFASVALAPVALAHFNDKEPLQSYRQSMFTLIAMNFGPIASMVKGEIPWDAEKLEGYADDLEDITELDLLRGFAPGSEKGTTRAKPAIWENTDDFAAKLEDLRAATEVLEEAAEDGDREAIAAAVGTVGKACKACHDEYKAKDYLY